MIKDNINSNTEHNTLLEHKIGSSLDTIATVSRVLPKKASLTSLVSFQSDPDHQSLNGDSSSKKLFIRFLQSKQNQSHHLKLLQKIRLAFEEMSDSNVHQKISLICPPLQKTDGFVPNDLLQPLSFCAEGWLASMGYRKEDNKKYILTKAKMRLKIEMMSKAVRFYEQFGKGFVSEEDRFRLVIGTCRNGWEFFIEKLVAKVQGTIKCSPASS